MNPDRAAKVRTGQAEKWYFEVFFIIFWSKTSEKCKKKPDFLKIGLLLNK